MLSINFVRATFNKSSLVFSYYYFLYFYFADTGHNASSNEPDAIHYSNGALTAEENSQPLPNEQYQQEYDPNQDHYMQQQEYYDQSQYDGNDYQQNYEDQYEQQYISDPNTGYVDGQQYEAHYEETPTVEEEKIVEKQDEESEKKENVWILNNRFIAAVLLDYYFAHLRKPAKFVWFIFQSALYV